MPQTILHDRTVLSLSGEDRFPLLQGLVTVDVDRLKRHANIFGALLSPQAKILFDFFLHRAPADETIKTIKIDIDAARADDFLRRMGLYKLRAKAEISLTDHCVVVAWDEAKNEDDIKQTDARHPLLGKRWTSADRPRQTAAASDYHSHRISLGIPEAGKDFAYDDIFPHDAMMDVLKGVDFKKGCYVGQEVVSRVQHRRTARKRFVVVNSANPLPKDTPLKHGGKTIGQTGSHANGQSLALVRLDRLHADTDPIYANNQPVTLQKPDYFIHFENQQR